jgi:hypothetical protein
MNLTVVSQWLESETVSSYFVEYSVHLILFEIGFLDLILTVV